MFFQQRLDVVKTITEKFVAAIIENLERMPYGIRFISRQLLAELKEKFPPTSPDEEERLVHVIANLVYYRYMNPAVVRHVCVLQ
jgi:Ras GTPase-activating-like protein IQGAP2/3